MMEVHLGSVFFATASEVEAAANVLFVPASLLKSGLEDLSRAFEAVDDPLETVGGGEASLAINMQCAQLERAFDTSLEGSARKGLARLILRFGEWPAVARKISGGLVVADMVPSTQKKNAGVVGKSDLGAAREKAKVRLEKFSGELAQAWRLLPKDLQTGLRKETVGEDRTSETGALNVAYFIRRPEEFLPVMGRLLICLLLDPTQSSRRHNLTVRDWTVVQVVLDGLFASLSHEDYWKPGSNEFVAGMRGVTKALWIAHLFEGSAAAIVSPQLIVATLRAVYAKKFPISILPLLNNFPASVIQFLEDRHEFRPVVESPPSLDEATRATLAAKGSAHYLKNYFALLTGYVRAGRGDPPSANLREPVDALFQILEGRSFDADSQEVFEAMFRDEKGREPWWLTSPAPVDETVQSRLDRSRRFLELLAAARVKSEYFGGWLDEALRRSIYDGHYLDRREFFESLANHFHDRDDKIIDLIKPFLKP